MFKEIAARVCKAALAVLLCVMPAATAEADELNHLTQSDFAPGSFFQTVLGGTEENPEISLGSYTFLSWNFDDDDIEGWTYDFNESGNIAEESPWGAWSSNGFDVRLLEASNRNRQR